MEKLFLQDPATATKAFDSLIEFGVVGAILVLALIAIWALWKHHNKKTDELAAAHKKEKDEMIARHEKEVDVMKADYRAALERMNSDKEKIIQVASNITQHFQNNANVPTDIATLKTSVEHMGEKLDKALRKIEKT